MSARRCFRGVRRSFRGRSTGKATSGSMETTSTRTTSTSQAHPERAGKKPGLLGTIFRKAQNKIQDPAKLKRLVSDLIGKELWMTLEVDVKGDAYEGLLEKNAADVKGGAD